MRKYLVAICGLVVCASLMPVAVYGQAHTITDQRTWEFVNNFTGECISIDLTLNEKFIPKKEGYTRHTHAQGEGISDQGVTYRLLYRNHTTIKAADPDNWCNEERISYHLNGEGASDNVRVFLVVRYGRNDGNWFYQIVKDNVTSNG